MEQPLDRHPPLAFQREALDELGLGDADSVDQYETIFVGGVGRDDLQVGVGDGPYTSTLHLLEVVPRTHHAHEHHHLDGLHVGAGGDQVDGDADARVVAGAEVLQELLGLGAVGCLVGDLGDHVVSLAQLLTGDAHDVLGVAVVLGEDQRLGDVAQPPVVVDLAVGEHGRQVVTDRPDDGADLVLGDHLLVEGLLVVGEVLVDLFEALVAGLAVTKRRPVARLDGGAALADRRREAEHVEIDVHAVGHGFGEAVLHDQVLVEEPERLLARRGGEADEEGVEVLEHLAPHAIDGAVAFVDDDHVERLDRQRRLVVDLHRPVRHQLVAGRLVDVFGQVGVAAQHRVHALDGADTHAGHRVDLVVREVLDVVELGELAARAGHLEALELLERLLPEVGPVDEEQDALGLSVADQPLAHVRRGERLARTGGHLDQRSGVVVLERSLQIGDRCELGIAQPGRIVLQLGHGGDAGPKRAAGVFDLALDLPHERLGPVEPEHPSSGRLGIHAAGEPGLVAGGLVAVGHTAVDQVGRQGVGQVGLVLDGLPLHTREGGALLFRLDDPNGLAVHEQHVVGRAGVGDQFPHGDARAGVEVHGLVVLHNPAGRRQHRVDTDAGALLRQQGVVVVGGHRR